jgi:DNA invertase Pin-like site-specific DNA recombinase
MSHKLVRLKAGHSQIIGYARVSTREQSLDSQIDELTRAGACRIYSETVSSVAHRTGWAALMGELRADDTVCVVRLDRIGRRLAEVVQACAAVSELGAYVRATAQGIDTRSAAGRAILPIWAALAETERTIMLERTLEGLAAARARGRIGGRPTVRSEAKDELIRHLRAEGHSLRAIGRSLQISEGTVRRAIADNDQKTPEKQQLQLGVDQ